MWGVGCDSLIRVDDFSRGGSDGFVQVGSKRGRSQLSDAGRALRLSHAVPIAEGSVGFVPVVHDGFHARDHDDGEEEEADGAEVSHADDGGEDLLLLPGPERVAEVLEPLLVRREGGGHLDEGEEEVDGAPDDQAVAETGAGLGDGLGGWGEGFETGHGKGTSARRAREGPVRPRAEDGIVAARTPRRSTMRLKMLKSATRTTPHAAVERMPPTRLLEVASPSGRLSYSALMSLPMTRARSAQMSATRKLKVQETQRIFLGDHAKHAHAQSLSAMVGCRSRRRTRASRRAMI